VCLECFLKYAVLEDQVAGVDDVSHGIRFLPTMGKADGRHDPVPLRVAYSE
jgi:CRISPR-associated DxTHG motif protein